MSFCPKTMQLEIQYTCVVHKGVVLYRGKLHFYIKKRRILRNYSRFTENRKLLSTRLWLYSCKRKQLKMNEMIEKPLKQKLQDPSGKFIQFIESLLQVVFKTHGIALGLT